MIPETGRRGEFRNFFQPQGLLSLLSLGCYPNLLLETYSKLFELSRLNSTVRIPEGRISVHHFGPCANTTALYLMNLQKKIPNPTSGF